MLERLAGHEYYCFLDGFSGYFQIPIALEDQEKTTFTCPYKTFAYKRIPFGLCNAPTTFQRCMTTIFHELIEDIMEVFMDDFSIFGSSFDHYLKNLEKMLKRMAKVIKGEFKKIKDVKVEDVSLTCDTPLEIFNTKVSRFCEMDNDLFTYEVEVANIPCNSKMDDDSEDDADDDMGYDPSDVAFIEWLRSRFFNYKTMDHYIMKALWIYWIRGDDEVGLTDEESSNDEDEIAEVFRIETNIFDYETPLCSTFNEFNYLLKVDPDLLTKDIMGFKTYEDYKDDWIYEWNKDVPWVDEKPWTNAGVWTKPTLVKHTCKPFNYKTGCSEWPTCSWMDDRYCNGGNLPGTYIIENQLHYQDYEWYEALEDCEVKDEALRNKNQREDVAVDVESLSTKYPIVDWKTYTLSENFMHYKITRGDGSSKNYKILSEMLYDFDRQDVVELYRLVKERYSFSKPEGYD
ncbi:VIER F-box protein 2 [Tanacetum coccineum]